MSWPYGDPERRKRYAREYYRRNFSKKNWYTRERFDTPNRQRRPVREELFWAAGFLDGEGCFVFINRKPGVVETRVEATQVDRWPLERLQEIFGGRIYKRRAAKRNQSNFFRWTVHGTRALGIAQTLYPMLSPRRQSKILSGLAALKAVGAVEEQDA